MGGGISSKRYQKRPRLSSIKSMTTTTEELNEAKGASSCLKANVVGKVKRRDFREIYELNSSKEALGSGMTGTVREWKNKITGQSVAIKCVQKRGLDPRAVDSMRDEIQLLSQLDHPNIVKIIDAFENDQCIALVMEICDGAELFDHVAFQAQFTQEKAACVFKQMVGAVGYCHKMHVAHRDLKLENFVFESTEQNSQIKLIDFGLSKKYTGGGINRMKSTVGTPYYMAPEVLKREKAYGSECDIWSLGVLLFMLLAGKPPFEGDNEVAIIESIKRNKIKFEKKFWTDKPEAKTLIKNMLRVKRKKRYTCDQVLASPWLKKFACETDISKQQIISAEVIKSMIAYAKMEKLKKTAVQVVAFTLLPVEIKELRDLFKALDTDGSGTLSLKEFRAGMERHKGMDPKSITELFAKIDSDHTGLISYSEFISASLSTSVHLNKEKFSAAFDKLDPDADGFIDSHELGDLLKGSVGQPDIDKMIANADSHGENDGKISKEEFVALVQKKT